MHKYATSPTKQELIAFLDLTSLEGTDSVKSITHLCDRAKLGLLKNDKLYKVAAVCVYPIFITIAREELSNSGIKLAVVSTYFPSGMVEDDVLVYDVKHCVKKGVDEIDIVINRGQLLNGEFEKVAQTIQSIRAVSEGITLKVILETCELVSEENIRIASRIALENGADFLKTSTGKGKSGADLLQSRIMLEEIKAYYTTTGKKVGFKAAGGIRTYEKAIEYYQLVEAVCGATWLHPNLFRIGASGLYNELVGED